MVNLERNLVHVYIYGIPIAPRALTLIFYE
jgi:hypothetical protein